MARIFISYRRDDSSGHAGRLFDHLRTEFGKENVFMDVEAIDPGADFVERIESALATVDVFVAVLGRNWASAMEDGERRLDDPQDHVRREIAAALRRPITVIPVLVGGAGMPKPEELPEELLPLRRRNALQLGDHDWESGKQRLVAAIERALGERGRRGGLRPPPPGPPEPRTGTLPLVAGLLGAALLAAATVLRWDAIARPDFGGGDVPGLGFVVAPAPVVVSLGAVLALLRAWRGGPGALETGLLLGFAVAGAAKHAALLGRYAAMEAGGGEEPGQWGSQLSLLLGLGGSLLLAGAALAWLVTWHRREGRFAAVPGRVLAALGAILMLAATGVPFNVVRPESAQLERVVLRTGWEALDPVALAIAVVVALLLAGRAQRLAVSGALIAIGIAGTLLWLRYVGVPALQMLQGDDLAEVRPGGAVGLVGSLLVWRAGVVAGRSAAREVGAAAADRST